MVMNGSPLAQAAGFAWCPCTLRCRGLPLPANLPWRKPYRPPEAAVK
jgi:hypothetical protein